MELKRKHRSNCLQHYKNFKHSALASNKLEEPETLHQILIAEEKCL